MKRINILLGFLALFILSSCNSIKINEMNPIIALDTVISITFYNSDNYLECYNDIKKIYYNVDDIADDFNSKNGNVYDLNSNREIKMNKDLKELIEYALEYKDITNGSFNPFIGRLSHLWKSHLDNKTVLDNETISKEISIMNHTSISFCDDSIRLIGDGNLDLGGIAKGYATMKAYECIKSYGITDFILNAGSSNIVCGNKPNGAFRLGLNDPYGSGYIKVININNKCISTSSGEHQNVIIDDVRYHHLINPFTGYPTNYYDSVITFGDNSMALDVYSTAISMMDIDSAIEFASKENIDVILYKDGKILYEGKEVY